MCGALLNVVGFECVGVTISGRLRLSLRGFRGSLRRSLSMYSSASMLSSFCLFTDSPVGGNGLMGLGIKGAQYVAEDGTVIAHEYGHALLSMGTNGRFLIARSDQFPCSEAVPINEGFGDYWALSTFFKQTTDVGFDVDCYGEWAHGTDCTRHYTDKPSYTLFSDSADNHDNGQIWSGALYEIFMNINNRTVADYVILKGHYLRARVGPAPTMPSIAEGIVISATQNLAIFLDPILGVGS